MAEVVRTVLVHVELLGLLQVHAGARPRVGHVHVVLGRVVHQARRGARRGEQRALDVYGLSVPVLWTRLQHITPLVRVPEPCQPRGHHRAVRQAALDRPGAHLVAAGEPGGHAAGLWVHDAGDVLVLQRPIRAAVAVDASSQHHVAGDLPIHLPHAPQDDPARRLVVPHNVVLERLVVGVRAGGVVDKLVAHSAHDGQVHVGVHVGHVGMCRSEVELETRATEAEGLLLFEERHCVHRHAGDALFRGVGVVLVQGVLVQHSDVRGDVLVRAG